MTEAVRDMTWVSLFEPLDMLKKAKHDFARLIDDLAKLRTKEVPYSVIDFCLAVYHVKDWLIQGSGCDGKEVESYIDGNAALSVMRDLCNGTKHYGLDLERLPKGAGTTVKESGFSATGSPSIMGLPVYKLKIRAEHSSPTESRDFEYWGNKALEAWDMYYAAQRTASKKSSESGLTCGAV